MIEIPTYSEHKLSQFAEQERGKAMGLLQRRFPVLSWQDCEDIIQESFFVLFQKNKMGELRQMTASLSTYFIRICINKAHEALRARGRMVEVEDSGLDFLDAVRDDRVEQLLTFDDESSLREEKEALAHQIVQDLPQPCHDLLWGYYRDNFSMRTMANMLGSTPGSVKVTKHRCQEKFRQRWSSLAASLY